MLNVKHAIAFEGK